MKKILLVEDNKLLRTSLEKGLVAVGYELETAENGAEGLKKAMEMGNELGIIISDIMMPIVDGYQMLKEIRINTILKDLPFIFLSAIADLDNLEKARELKVTDYLIKENISIERLDELIKKYI
ncbi:TPA: response regulator [candidate division CPR2 bacterium]|uniref:Transcriptional regulator, Crp/Fnr family n=1 Tax=candidate division CPR2 bacterium GW2011_GWC1_41_48 TaxID=1618344 RepID=A0A0G0W7L9_UNCC2|nr:MAG: Transcriptional regulator, Crp/Fnr family [candidate division CPR2 bacterium GW2011_GWC2_39_35]KKR28886.1 MAG: Transcriptional regulator, Crp/Fnr family [candidate division CPR2 bacterium GW2011_GWD2_39_7]KKR29533.1 MAG: Transcriptional regulator, Crp/Fnr family [candidate division CPR2 bacterium GW2011_GWD1_39_7]KKS08955.1 MAG: Transcriptional regulator, Crp/Fnr family [candidate division CPR2 bacterium GW2011_GWC1_41_48]OGB55746.1 MAG: hypothetical protein A2Y27_01100 [candidate divis